MLERYTELLHGQKIPSISSDFAGHFVQVVKIVNLPLFIEMCNPRVVTLAIKSVVMVTT